MNIIRDPLKETFDSISSADLPGAAPRQDHRELIELLSEEASLYGNLLELTKEEQQAITGSGPEKILEIAGKKDSLVAKISTLETQRIEFLASLSSKTSIPLVNLTLSSLLNTVDENQAPFLRDIGACLSSSVRELERLNKQNALLLQSMLRVISDEIEFVIQLTNEGIGYTNAGKTRGGTENSAILDVRA